MPRVAIYARFSTDRQSQTSAEDQVRVCRERAEREGWTVADVYTDLAISGANIRRPGMTALLRDLADGAYDIVLAEALDRIARDQEDVAGIYKRVCFADAKLVTLTEGEVSELHIGLKGTMDALELKKMADKIRRGAMGALSRGRIPGGLCYGYEADPLLRDDGSVDRGRRRIVPDQAAVVRRVYAEYLAGRSPRRIAQDLNADGIPSARGGEWRQSAITGHAKRQLGILTNPIYVGRFVWNRVRMVKHPETRRRLSRNNDAAEQRTIELPDLRIIDDATWQAVQAQLGSDRQLPLPYRQRPRHFLSGIVLCGACGGRYIVIDRNRWGCSRHREAGTCANGRRIAGAELEERVLRGLQEKLLSPEAVQLLVREYHLERERVNRRSVGERERALRRVKLADAAIARLVDALADGGATFPEIRSTLAAKRAERDRAAETLAEHEAAPVIALHPQIADAYRQRIRALALTLKKGEVTTDSSAGQVRALIDQAIVTPQLEGQNDIEVFGSLQAVIGLATGNPLPGRGGSRRGCTRVAEEGLEPPTRGL